MTTWRFGVFLFDSKSGELSRDGRPIRLQPQPAQVLAALLVHAGQLVTREELRRVVWPDDTFVDFDRGLNFCIAQVRTALGDDAASPRYIRTVPKRGYELICPVEALAPPPAPAETATPPIEAAAAVSDGRTRRRRLLLAAAVVIGIGLSLGAIGLLSLRPHAASIVAVVRADNETGDPSLTRFADALTDTLVVQLTEQSGGEYAVVGNAAILRSPRQTRDLTEIGRSLSAAYVVLTQIQRDNERFRVLSHLIRLPDQTHVTVSRTDGIAAGTLADTDRIATRIAGTFAPRLRPGDDSRSRTAVTR